MGCDIHLFVEVRDGAGKPWRLQRVTWRPEPTEHEPNPEDEVGYDWRNYGAFAILADVRNTRDHDRARTKQQLRQFFPGWEPDWGHCAPGYNPISEPRGLPDDVSDDLKAINADESEGAWERAKEAHGAGWLGDHSFSWLTLRELLEYNWNQRTSVHGIVTPGAFREYLAAGKPSSYCGGVGGRSVRMLPEPLMREFVESCEFSETKPRSWDDRAFKVVGPWSPELAQALAALGITRANHTDYSLYCAVKWSESYKESAGAFHSKFIPALAELGHDRDDVRIVFGFDS